MVHTCDHLVDGRTGKQAEEQVDDGYGLWTQCTASLREQVSDTTWEMWLSAIEPVVSSNLARDGVIVLGVPNAAIRERVESRFVPLIEGTLASLAGKQVHVRLQVLEHVPPAIPTSPPNQVQFGRFSSPEPGEDQRNGSGSSAAASRESAAVA